MTLFLWILQILLALVMLAAGGGKLAQPYARDRRGHALGQALRRRRSRASRRGRGPRALGLDLPAATGIARSSHRSPRPAWRWSCAAPWPRTPGRGVVAHIAVNVVLLAVAVVVAWGRFGPYAW
ncbi:DoxX family protein [Streptomyces sp. KL116D]|uniref:DoxX family protein n=1 Tax=Streptomyces sp. KL116D TaxID=3045152 RepID=UPI00355700FC